MMTMQQRLEDRGWPQQLINTSKVVAAIMVIGGFILGGLSLFSVTVAIPSRVAALESNVGAVQQGQATLGNWVRFLTQTECARLAADVKNVMRNAGGVDCDSEDLRINRPAPSVKIPP